MYGRNVLSTPMLDVTLQYVVGTDVKELRRFSAFVQVFSLVDMVTFVSFDVAYSSVPTRCTCFLFRLFVPFVVVYQTAR